MASIKHSKIAILGAGNAGFAHAADLSLKGFDVALFELPAMADTIAQVRQVGTIKMEADPSTGLRSGVCCPRDITTNVEQALDGAYVIFLVVPAYAQIAFAQAIARHVRKDQILLLSPGCFGGTIVFDRALREFGCKSSPILCEAQSMVYSCRKSGPASVRIMGIKESLRVASFPSAKIDSAISSLRLIYPTLQPAPNVLWTGLSNPNPILHPAITILNSGRIENTRGNFLFYTEGLTRAVSLVVEALDRERLALGGKFGLELIPHDKMTSLFYGHQGYTGSTYGDIAKNPAYLEIRTEQQLSSRYLCEDIPFGLVPWEAMGQLVGLDMPICTALINMGNALLGQDFRATGRSPSQIGWEGFTAPEISEFLNSGTV